MGERLLAFALAVGHRLVPINAKRSVRLGEAQPGEGEARVSLDHASQKREPEPDARRRAPPHRVTPAQEELVRLDVVSRPHDHRRVGRLEPEHCLQLPDDRARDLVLDGENVVEVAVPAFTPLLRAAACGH